MRRGTGSELILVVVAFLREVKLAFSTRLVSASPKADVGFPRPCLVPANMVLD